MLLNRNRVICGLTSSLLMTASAFAEPVAIGPVQRIIGSELTLSVSLPSDGSSCDPKVIEKNLVTLQKANILNATNLTPTEAYGSCYGPCPEDLEKALKEHCAKAALLEEIVNLIERQ